MDITKIRLAYDRKGSMKNAFDLVSSLMPLIKLKSDNKIQSIKDLILDIERDPPNKTNQVKILTTRTLRTLCDNFISKLKILFENNILLVIDDQDCHQQWRELAEDYPWLKEAESIYRITDIPDEQDKKTLYIQSDFLTKLLDVNGVHLLDRKNDADGFFCLMYTKRLHRDLLFEKLRDSNFIGDSNLIIYHTIPNNTMPDYHEMPDYHASADNYILAEKKRSSFVDLVGFNQSSSHWQDGQISPPYNKYALELVVETSMNVIFHTEKTSRPLLAGMSVMNLGAPGHLASLRSIGFKTFDQFWNESYDIEPDLDKRINMILDNLKTLAATPGMMLDIYKQTKHIAEHNRNNILAIKGQAPFRDADKLKNFIEGI